MPGSTGYSYIKHDLPAQSEYNPLAYPQRQIAQGPLDNYSNDLGMPSKNRFNWYK
jgi:hypothetical protein